jgi:ribosomal protein S18 acetylase RimI-like enzyme
MPEIEIRPAVAADIHPLTSLKHNYSSDYVWQMDLRRENDEIRVTFREIRLPRSVQVMYPHDPLNLIDDWNQRDGLLVAVLENEPVGYISLTLNTSLKTVWGTDLVVKRDLRRQGIGIALTLSAQEWATQTNARRMILEMQPKNHPAIQLAQKLGFELCGYNDHYFINNDIALFFARWLR